MRSDLPVAKHGIPAHRIIWFPANAAVAKNAESAIMTAIIIAILRTILLSPIRQGPTPHLIYRPKYTNRHGSSTHHLMHLHVRSRNTFAASCIVIASWLEYL